MQEKATIYTKPGCPFCRAAKDDLIRRGIAYEEINVQGNRKALEEMRRLADGESIVPVIVEGDKVTVGFGGDG